MKIAVLGAGNIGGSLGQKWAKAGHKVVFGVRDPASPKVESQLANTSGRATARLVSEAIVHSEVVLFAIPHSAVSGVVQQHADALDGKLLIDATNAFFTPAVSNIDAIHSAAPNAKLYRAFNALGWESFANPDYGSTIPDLFYCGTPGSSQMTMQTLITQVGLRPIYLGGLELTPVVDALGTLWITLATRQGWGRGIALKLIER